MFHTYHLRSQALSPLNDKMESRVIQGSNTYPIKPKLPRFKHYSLCGNWTQFRRLGDLKHIVN